LKFSYSCHKLKLTHELRPVEPTGAFLIAAVFATVIARASGEPITGTITAVTADTLTIKDENHRPVTIRLDKRTIYLKDGKRVTKSDLKIGTHVVIDANVDAKLKMYSAAEVDIGTSE
jgi:hypothetical protein